MHKKFKIFFTVISVCIFFIFNIAMHLFYKISHSFLSEFLLWNPPLDLHNMANNETDFNTTVISNSSFVLADTTVTEFEDVADSNSTVSTTPLQETPFYLNFRDEPWVIPLVSLSLFNIAAILIFEVYVLYKSCGGRRHLFLGQILLLGLFLCSILGLLYVPQPHWLFCGITRAGLGIVYAIIFGSLLVKCVFLLKLHDGVYFNASFQGLFLFFVVAVEVSMWLIKNYR